LKLVVCSELNNFIYIIRTKANLLMRKGIDPKLKNTLVASLAPADSNDLMQPPLIKSNSSAKNERGRASIRGLSNQIGGGIKNSAQHKMSSGSSSGAGVITDA
jgi:hypothetical protein